MRIYTLKRKTERKKNGNQQVVVNCRGENPQVNKKAPVPEAELYKQSIGQQLTLHRKIKKIKSLYDGQRMDSPKR